MFVSFRVGKCSLLDSCIQSRELVFIFQFRMEKQIAINIFFPALIFFVLLIVSSLGCWRTLRKLNNNKGNFQKCTKHVYDSDDQLMKKNANLFIRKLAWTLKLLFIYIDNSLVHCLDKICLFLYFLKHINLSIYVKLL